MPLRKQGVPRTIGANKMKGEFINDMISMLYPFEGNRGFQVGMWSYFTHIFVWTTGQGALKKALATAEDWLLVMN